MIKTQFTLISKQLLTHDVYELTYSCPAMVTEPPKPGQYVMFQLSPGLNRAYSMASFTMEEFTLIIKRIPDGRGSPILCDAEIGTSFGGLLPLGHFILQNTPRTKCFIGTGTGFAPVYCQALAYSLSSEKAGKVSFIFGVREIRDSFYEDKIIELGNAFTDFSYLQYFSRESSLPQASDIRKIQYQIGYVTDWITPENIVGYEEYYLCGSPAMVKSAREKLETLGITKADIFWEQF